MDVYIYDMLGRTQVDKKVDLIGGQYNKIQISPIDFVSGQMATGTYYVVIVVDEKVLSKTKYGIIP